MKLGHRRPRRKVGRGVQCPNLRLRRVSRGASRSADSLAHRFWHTQVLQAGKAARAPLTRSILNACDGQIRTQHGVLTAPRCILRNLFVVAFVWSFRPVNKIKQDTHETEINHLRGASRWTQRSHYDRAGRSSPTARGPSAARPRTSARRAGSRAFSAATAHGRT